jgi:hypothetical protein
MQEKDYMQFGLIALNILITVWLAFRQHGINKINLKISLYEKRYKIYESTYNFLSDFLLSTFSTESIKRTDLIIDFKTNVHQSIFLFDDEIEKYLLKVLNSAEKIHALKCREQDYIEELEWFEKQKIEARNYFKKFMKFKI